MSDPASFPASGGRARARLTGVAIAAGGMLLLGVAAAAAGPQEERQRLRQLEVFEELLTEAVQDFVNSQVQVNISDEINRDQDGDGVPDQIESPLVVRVGSASAAHGLYIAGYGVIFSIQIPQVAVIPRTVDMVLQTPVAIRGFNEPPSEEAVRQVTSRMLASRARTAEHALEELETLVEKQIRDGASDETIQRQMREIEEARRVFERFTRAIHADPERPLPEIAESETVAAEREAAAEEASERQARRAYELAVSGYGRIADRRSMSDVVERNQQQIASVVVNATIDTLAQFGSVIKGLDDDDRISIVVLPPTPFSMLRRHSETQQEFVVTVRHRDIRDLDNQRIDLAAFRQRVDLHSRGGEELALPEPQQQQPEEQRQ